MALFNELVTLVAPFAPNVPAFTAGNAIRESARRFFKKVHAWQEEVTLPVVPGTSMYQVPLSNGQAEIVAIMEVKRSDYDVLTPYQRDNIIEINGAPTGYLGQFDRELKLVPTPEQSENLTVTVAVRPTFSAAEIDDAVLNESAEALRFGALAILKSQPGTEWHSPSDVGYYTDLFDQEVNSKRMRMISDHLSYQPQAEIPKFL